MSANQLSMRLRRMRDLVAEMNQLADDINMDLAAVMGERVVRNPRVACIKQAVADAYGISIGLLTSKIKTQPAPEARHVAIYFSHSVLGLSKSEVCRNFRVDKNMVNYAVAAVGAQKDTNRDFARRLSELSDVISCRLREMGKAAA